MPVPEHVLDQLNGAPPADFVRTRARLAAELRKTGEPYAAMEVEAWRKPTTVVWAINQLARGDRGALERAFRSADALRAVQLGQAPGGAETLKHAAAEHREAVDALVERAGATLRVASLPATRATLDRIVTTVRAAVTGADARDALRRGRLTAELAPNGFEALAAESRSRGTRARPRATHTRPPGPAVPQG